MTVQAPPRLVVDYFGNQINEFARKVSAAWYSKPFQVTSWWRSRESNARVGGHRFSQHLTAMAIDAVADDLVELEVAMAVQGLRTVRYSTHVHAQLWEAGRLERLARSG